MPAPKKKQPSAIDVMTWALGQLADQSYIFEAERDSGRWELHIYDPIEDEARLPFTEEEGRKIEESLVSALSKVFPNPDDQVAFIARLTVQKFIHRGRERLGGTEVASLERDLLALSGEVVREAIASAYLKAFAGEFEKLVGRAEQLRVPDTSAAVPEQVQSYLAEATRCYVYGRYIACLLVCRSAIELALRDRLKREDTIERLIGYGREKLPWTLRPTFDLADEVRVAANRAVHPGLGAAPTANMCREMFYKTRAVLGELYSEQDFWGPLGKSSTA
jgi:hypothetical protein